MKDVKVLYQIENLEKAIMRFFIRDLDVKKLDNCCLIPPTQMQIIGYILENKDKNIYQKDLEKVLNLTRATVSGVLATMEKNNLIERVITEDDARAKKIILNANAREIFDKNRKKLEKIEKVVVKDISSNDLETFSRVLEKMKSNVEDMNLEYNKRGRGV